MSEWRSFRRLLAGSVLLSLLGSTPTPAAAPAGSKDAKSTTITSQRMTVRNQDNKAVFEGSVVLVKGGLTVHSETMVVFFKPTDSAGTEVKSGEGRTEPAHSAPNGKAASRDDVPTLGNRSVHMIEATGKIVTIEKETGKATCQKAIYYGDEDKLVLLGDPIAWDKGTRVNGKKITMYLSEDRSVVEGGSRVRIEQDGGPRQ